MWGVVEIALDPDLNAPHYGSDTKAEAHAKRGSYQSLSPLLDSIEPIFRANPLAFGNINRPALEILNRGDFRVRHHRQLENAVRYDAYL